VVSGCDSSEQATVTLRDEAGSVNSLAVFLPGDEADEEYSSSPRRQKRSYLCWRYCLDFLFCLIGGVSLCLLFPVIASLIYLDSPGPILYSQERVGYQGRQFRIWKFRSMCQDAEKRGIMCATEGDCRITRIGRWLRATHLDEVPQVINILRGEMSLIGPRPERPLFNEQFQESIPKYRLRLCVKPGLTGLAQVKYHYASTQNDAVIKLWFDLYYVKYRSIILDIFIIYKTIMEMLLMHGR
jgi:lipopolysaccharide/colanic/teichoic acid biosynthesis glycosyltransferase